MGHGFVERRVIRRRASLSACGRARPHPGLVPSTGCRCGAARAWHSLRPIRSPGSERVIEKCRRLLLPCYTDGIGSSSEIVLGSSFGGFSGRVLELKTEGVERVTAVFPRARRELPQALTMLLAARNIITSSFRFQSLVLAETGSDVLAKVLTGSGRRLPLDCRSLSARTGRDSPAALVLVPHASSRCRSQPRSHSWPRRSGCASRRSTAGHHSGPGREREERNVVDETPGALQDLRRSPPRWTRSNEIIRLSRRSWRRPGVATTTFAVFARLACAPSGAPP